MNHLARSSDAELTTRARNALLWSAGITLALYLIPYGEYVAYPLLLLSTLVHELGHGIAAMIVGGSFQKFVMHADGSGVATWTHRGIGGMAQAFVSAGGLCGPAVGAAVCFGMARRASWARYTLGAFGFLLILAEILVVRNGFGFGFVAIVAAVCLLIAFFASEAMTQVSLVFLGVQLALAVFSRADYLFVEGGYVNGQFMGSDTKHMEAALGLPYWFWGGLCAAFSLVVLVGGAYYFLRGSKVPRMKRATRRATKLADSVKTPK